MYDALRNRIESFCGAKIVRLAALSGGCIAQVRLIVLADGRELVAKIGQAGGDNGFAIEGAMLAYLGEKTSMPVPTPYLIEDDLLLMSCLSSSGGMTRRGQEEVAEAVAALHNVRAESFGFGYDTLIGGLHQPNPRYDRWIDFFGQQRLLYMAEECLKVGHIDAALMGRIEAFLPRLNNWIDEPPYPSLIHGDLWSGNVLYEAGGFAGLVDPALYYADAEMEMTFSTVYSSFGDPFFQRYKEIRPLRPGFKDRREIYNLFPLLVHARLFGGGYPQAVGRVLGAFGG